MSQQVRHDRNSKGCNSAEKKVNRKTKKKNKPIRQRNKSFLYRMTNEPSKKEKHEEIYIY